MKRALMTLGVMAVGLSAFAQAKVRFVNDTLHLVYLTPNTNELLPGDTPLAGMAYNGQVLADGQTLVADLYAGTSSSSLSLVASGASFPSTFPGTWVPQNLDLIRQGLGPGTNYFQVQVHETGSSGLSLAGYFGESPIFTSAANSGIAYFSIVQQTSPVDSTWADGMFPLDSVQSGALGAIEVGLIPEPSVLGLVGLGLVLAARRGGRPHAKAPKAAKDLKGRGRLRSP